MRVSIFGAMDFAARKIALATFKSRKANVMVVTDVAHERYRRAFVR